MKINFTSAVVSMALVSVFSCKKQETANTPAAPVAVDIYNMEEVEPNDQPVNLDSAVLYVDGKLADQPSSSLKSDELDDSLIFVYSGRFPGKQFCFSNTAQFEKWAKCYKSTEALIDANNKLTNLANKAVALNAISYFDKTGEISPEYAALIGTSAIGASSLKASVIQLFTQENFKGWSAGYSLGTPTLKNMNNNSMSYKGMLGVTALCDKTWFRGSRFYTLDLPYCEVPSLGWFNNRAESISPAL